MFPKVLRLFVSLMAFACSNSENTMLLFGVEESMVESILNPIKSICGVASNSVFILIASTGGAFIAVAQLERIIEADNKIVRKFCFFIKSPEN